MSCHVIYIYLYIDEDASIFHDQSTLKSFGVAHTSFQFRCLKLLPSGPDNSDTIYVLPRTVMVLDQLQHVSGDGVA